MSFKTQVEDIVGVSISDTSALSDFLTASAREVADILPKQALLHNATIDETTTDNSGYDAENKRILDVARNGRLSVEAPFGISTQLESSDSIYKASIRSPFHYYKGKTIFIKPDPTVSEKGQVFAFAYPTVAHDDTSGIPSFPDNAEFAVVLGAACKYFTRMVSDEIQSLPAVISISDLDMSSITAPTVPSLSSASISFSTTAPSYTKPSISLSGAPTIADLTISSVVPTVPTLSSNTVGNFGSMPTYVKPVVTLTDSPSLSALDISGTSAPIAPSLSDNSVGSFGSMPTYSKPIVSLDITQFETFLETEEDGELAKIQLGRINSELDEYRTDVQNELNKFNSQLAEYNSNVQKAIEDAKLSSNDDVQKLQKYQAEISSYQAKISQDVQKFREDNQQSISVWEAKRRSEISQYQTDVQNELNKFNGQLAEYQSTVQKAIENARLSSQDDAQALQLYSNEIANYQQNVNKEIQEWRANTDKEIQLFQIKRNTELQQYQSDIQNELNEFNKENVEYSSELNKAIELARLESQDDVQLMQKAVQDIALYNSKVNEAVQEYQSNLSQNIQEMGSNLQRSQVKIQSLQQQYAQCEAKYQSELKRLSQNN